MAVEGWATDDSAFLDSVDGEVSLFRNVMRARPLGIHRHFHLLTIRNGVRNDTGKNLSIDDIWAKLRTCYNMDTLESFEPEGFEPGGDPISPPLRPVDSPSPTAPLYHHPFFRFEYALPADDWIDAEMARRRTRDTPSPPSSRPPTPPPAKRARGGPTRGRGKRASLAAAGLVAGESDSSALTDDSPDEDAASVAPTVTGTDAGTEEPEEEEEETEGSPAPSSSRKRGKGRRGGYTGRGRGKGVKKRKR